MELRLPVSLKSNRIITIKTCGCNNLKLKVVAVNETEMVYFCHYPSRTYTLISRHVIFKCWLGSFLPFFPFMLNRVIQTKNNSTNDYSTYYCTNNKTDILYGAETENRHSTNKDRRKHPPHFQFKIHINLYIFSFFGFNLLGVSLNNDTLRILPNLLLPRSSALSSLLILFCPYVISRSL